MVDQKVHVPGCKAYNSITGVYDCVCPKEDPESIHSKFCDLQKDRHGEGHYGTVYHVDHVECRCPCHKPVQEIIFNGVVSDRRATIERRGYKDNQGKTRYSLNPVRVLAELADLSTMGAKKYDDDNWKKGMNFSDLNDALQRHLAAWWSGEEHCPVDGQHHLISVMWCAMALRHYMHEYPLYEQFDNRPHKSWVNEFLAKQLEEHRKENVTTETEGARENMDVVSSVDEND